MTLRLILSLLAFLSGVASAQVTAARPIARGDILSASDLVAEDPSLIAVFIGKAARRPIFEGRQVLGSDIMEPEVITRQETVAVLFKRGSLTLSLEGRALGAGAIGERIDIALKGRQAPLSAVVTGPGTVEVGS